MMICLSFPTTKAYMELIEMKIARKNILAIYIYTYIYCKVKPWIQRELGHTIKSRCACVWNIWWIYMVANLILLCSLKTYLSFEIWKYFYKKTWAILFISFFLFLFSGGHVSTHCFRYLRHLSIFSQLFFFMNNFCIAHASLLQQNF